MKNIHFIGICGTAMGAVASAMVKRGYKITGSDNQVYPPMSDFLEAQGIEISIGYRAENIPDDADIIIIGNAMSRGNEELEAVLCSKKRYMSLPECLKEFFLWNKRNYVVSGTHGKTTTTSMLAWLMEDQGFKPSFMIGGIARNLGRGGRFTESDFTVLEGDEYDTAFFDKRSKFLHYLPELVIMNNIEMDHIDIFKNIEAIKLSFEYLLRVIPSTGCLLYNADCPHCVEVAQLAPSGVPKKSVGFAADADIRICDLSATESGQDFTIEAQRYHVPMLGEFNVRNAAMAICGAIFAGMQGDKLASSLALFKGVARRQELRGTEKGVQVIDDFAHHPSAIKQAALAFCAQDKGRVWLIFDPRSNTSASKHFQVELAAALKLGDFAVVAPIEKSDQFTDDTRLNLVKLQSDIESMGTPCYLGKNVEDIVAHVTPLTQEGDTLLIMSNGGFGDIHNKFLDALRAKN